MPSALQEVKMGIGGVREIFNAGYSKHSLLFKTSSPLETRFNKAAQAGFKFAILLPHLLEFCDYYLRTRKFYFLFI